MRCHFKNAVCFSCSLKWHMAKACRGTRAQEQGQLDEAAVAAGVEYRQLFCISQMAFPLPKYVVDVEVASEQVKMEVDLGAAWYIISQKEFEKTISGKAWEAASTKHSARHLDQAGSRSFMESYGASKVQGQKLQVAVTGRRE